MLLFFQLENIGNFVRAIQDYGLKPHDIFEANDLFENVNHTQVQSSLIALAGMVSDLRAFLSVFSYFLDIFSLQVYYIITQIYFLGTCPLKACVRTCNMCLTFLHDDELDAPLHTPPLSRHACGNRVKNERRVKKSELMGTTGECKCVTNISVTVSFHVTQTNQAFWSSLSFFGSFWMLIIALSAFVHVRQKLPAFLCSRVYVRETK